MKREINHCSSTEMQACATAGGGVMYIPKSTTQKTNGVSPATVSYKDLIKGEDMQHNVANEKATNTKQIA